MAERFDELRVTILGASFDTVEENRRFAQAQGFPFRLLSDTDHRVGAAYGVARAPGDKLAQYSRRFSYLIDPDGRIRCAYDVTDVAHHGEQVLADVEEQMKRP